MDKTNLVERSFEIANNQLGTKFLVMYSRKEGEFGTILCTCSCELNGFVTAAKVSDAAEPDAGFEFRLQELLFFCSFILPLFNPLNPLKDGLSSFPQPFPPASQSDQ